MGAPSWRLVVDAAGRMATGPANAPKGAAILDILRAEARRRAVQPENDAAAEFGAPLGSGLVGYVAYEFGGVLEPAARGPRTAALAKGVASPAAQAPLLAFGAFDAVIAFDHARRRVFAMAAAPIREAALARAGRLAAWLERAKPSEALSPALPLKAEPVAGARGAYAETVARIIERILDGDIFQANLTRQISLGAGAAPGATGAPFPSRAAYAALNAVSPAAYGAFLRIGDTDILSNSPEQFFGCRPTAGGLEMVSQPIKGTAPRSSNPDTDRRLAEGLRASAKDRAENAMIVDLMRNDFAKVCTDGSISVSRLCDLYSLPHLHHLVSEVRGVLRPGTCAIDALEALFPAGSITGAPKIRAMQILAEEEGSARGPYCGAIGYFDDGGGAEFNVAIRTLTVRQDPSGWAASFGVGGGVTARSNPEAEYLETEHKAAAFEAALQLLCGKGRGAPGARALPS